MRAEQQAVLMGASWRLFRTASCSLQQIAGAGPSGCISSGYQCTWPDLVSRSCTTRSTHHRHLGQQQASWPSFSWKRHASMLGNTRLPHLISREELSCDSRRLNYAINSRAPESARTRRLLVMTTINTSPPASLTWFYLWLDHAPFARTVSMTGVLSRTKTVSYFTSTLS